MNVTPPSSDGGSPIASYRVASNRGGVTATGTGSSIAVAGLSNGTSYTFTVVATNAVGNSPASTASNALTPSTAAPPLNANFVNAQVITGSDNTVSGTNVNATTEPGLPNTASGGASVWYALTVATGAGPPQIDTCGSDFSPLVGAYTGALAVFCGTTNTWISGRQVFLPLDAGTIYFAVEGGLGPTGPGEGNFNHHWGQAGG